MDVEIIRISEKDVPSLAPLTADFRVALKSYKGIPSVPDLSAANDELLEYLSVGFPVYAAIYQDEPAGYMVCRIDAPCVWVESLFVKEEFRGSGIANRLIEEAENLAHSFNEETVYFNVHPNNHRMISFLNKHGYNVLNLIEIRKPYSGEVLTQKIPVGEHLFDY